MFHMEETWSLHPWQVISACGAASQWLVAWQLLFSAVGLETNLIMFAALDLGPISSNGDFLGIF